MDSQKDTTENLCTTLRRVEHSNNFVEYPGHWPRWVNGTGEPCDMLQGPCACGAWHNLQEWERPIQ